MYNFKIDLNNLAKDITLEEGKKENLSIAQVREVLSITLKRLAGFSDMAVMELLERSAETPRDELEALKLEAVVAKLNEDLDNLYPIMSEKYDGMYYFDLSSDGRGHYHIGWLGFIIWDSDNDERPYTQIDKNEEEREPLEEWLRKQIRIIGKDILIFQENAGRG